MKAYFDALSTGKPHPFSGGLKALPQCGAGVYTIWHKDGRFIYVGMSGKAPPERRPGDYSHVWRPTRRAFATAGRLPFRWLTGWSWRP